MRFRQAQQNQLCEITFSGLIVIYLTISLIFGRNENDCGDFKTFIKGSLGFYCLDLILCMNQLMHVFKKRGDSYLFMLIGYIILVGNTAWYIFGTVQYYNNYLECNPEIVPKTTPLPQQNPSL